VFYGATRAAVVAKQKAAQQRLADGDTAMDSRTLLGPFLTRWCDVGLAASKVKVTTRDNYASIARTHLVPTLGHIRLDRLAASDVENLLVAKRQQGLSESTVRLIYTVLRRALDYAVRDGLVRRNAAALVDRPTVAYREAAYLSPVQAQSLLETARGHRLYAL
jgi:integrase